MQAEAQAGGQVFQAARDQYIYPGPAPAPVAVMCTLPRDTAAFTGRDEELGRLVAAVSEAAAAGRVGAVHAIDGMPGVGKTAFAVHAAHLLADRFPDGQLFVRLHAHTPGQRPVEPGDALAALLAGVGVASHAVPADAEARAALWRDRLAGRRELLVLDDAAGHEQVEPLLPAAAGCVVLVTSRRRLTALVDAAPLPLDILPPLRAAELFTRLAARSVTGPEAAAVAQLVRLCGYLPLAVALLAGRLRHHPTWSIDDLTGDLATAQDRLGELHAEDVAVAAAFELSYRDLPADRRRLFRRLGLHPGTDIDAYAAAALDDLSLREARRNLDALYTDHLIDEPVRGRYRLHDLIRDYVTQLAGSEDTEADRREALTRLFDHYLATAATAMDTLYPAEQHRRPRIPRPATPTPPVADPPAAQAWLDTERTNLVAACTHTAAHGWAAHTIALAATLYRYLDSGGHSPEALTIHTHACRAARDTGDRGGEALALTFLGHVCLRQSRYKQAAEHLQQALLLWRQTGELAGEAGALTILGALYFAQGEVMLAVEHFEQAMRLCRQIGDHGGEARALNGLGAVYWRQGEPGRAAEHLHHALILCRQSGQRTDETPGLVILGLVYCRWGKLSRAVEHLQQALALCRQTGDRDNEVRALFALGLVNVRQGELAEAHQRLEQALELCQQTGERAVETGALITLGLVYCRQGRYERGVEHLHQGLALVRRIGDRAGEADALNGLGLVYQRQSHHAPATEHLQQALTLYRRIGDRVGEADALNGLGLVYQRQSHHALATEHLQQALTLYRRIGDRIGQADALNGLGETLRATGFLEDARTRHTDALTLAVETGNPDQQARAHDGIAATYQAIQDLDQARQHWQHALALYTELGVPDAETVRNQLAAVARP
jgi:tetratricopeptide (TPR) repeat protein